MAVARLAAAATSAAWMLRLAVKMMLWLASASFAGCAERAAPTPAPGATGAAADAALPRAGADEAVGLPEQPASSRAVPDISPAHMNAVRRSAVQRSGSAVPRWSRGAFEAPPSLLARS